MSRPARQVTVFALAVLCAVASAGTALGQSCSTGNQAQVTGTILAFPPAPGSPGILVINQNDVASPFGCRDPFTCQPKPGYGACMTWPMSIGQFEFASFGGGPADYTFTRTLGASCHQDPVTSEVICNGSFVLLGFLGFVASDSPHCTDCPANVGRPVNVVTGNAWLRQTDVSIPGAPGVTFSRSYSSLHGRDNRGGAFGRGWFHSYDQTVDFPAAGMLRVRQADGTALYFWDGDGDGTYDALVPKTEKSSVAASASGYTRTSKSGAVEVYDAAGRIVSMSNEAGQTTSYGRDGSGRLVSITGAGGRGVTLSYQSDGKIEGLLGPDGRIASYGYDAAGLLESVVYADGSGYRFSYDASAQLLRVLDQTGRVLERHDYVNGKAVTSELSQGQEKYTIAYGANGVSAVVTDALGNQTSYRWLDFWGQRKLVEIQGPCADCGGGGSAVQTFSYDVEGRRLSQTDGNGTTTYTYDAAGEVASVTDALGRVTSWSYDGRGRVLTQAEPGGRVVSYAYADPGPTAVVESVTASQTRTTALAYNGQGLVSTITDPRGKTTALAYDGFGQLVSVTDPLSHATSFGYDALGRRTSVTDALGHTTATAYDARDRVTRITSADGTHTDFSYDAAGRRTAVTDPLGRTIRYAYDAQGRLGAVVDALNGVTEYRYDAMSRLTSLKDARGNATVFEYDGYGRVTKVTYPGGAFESFAYDANGRLLTKTDRKGVTTTYSYDAIGRLTGKTYSDGTTPPVTYTYDTAGRLATAANGTDTLTWSYDLAGQLLSEQSIKNSSTVAYTYDNAGNRLSVSLDGSLFVSYAYDDASRLTTITRGSNVFGFGYDNANRRTSMTYPNAVTTSYVYDTLNRLTNLQAVHVPTSTAVTSFGYSYDAAGNRTRKQQLDYTEDYQYDPLYRLTGVERSAGLTGLQTFSYDAVGNRLTNQKDGTVSTSSYNEKNQLLSAVGGGLMLWRGTLDEPGNVTFTSALVNGKPARMLPGNVFEALLPMNPGSNEVTLTATDTSNNSISKSYSVNVIGDGATRSYDANGNLATKVEGADTWTYEWNAENQLTTVLKNAVEVASFKYDPNGRRVEKASGGVTTLWAYDSEDILRESTAGTTLRYVHGPGIDEPLAADNGSGLSYYHADALGSIGKTTGAGGAASLSRRYDAWGNLEDWAGDSGYAFTGREWNPETGLYYYRARYYNPKGGRFISEDPVGFAAGANFYGYVTNRVTSKTDPSGLQQVGGPLTEPNEPGVMATIGCLNGRLVVFTKVFDFEELNCGIASCVIKHERRHIQNLEKRCPPPCKNAPDLLQPGFGSERERQAEEFSAYLEEVKCLLRVTAGPSNGCQKRIDCRMRFIACLAANGFNPAACGNVSCP